MNVELSLLRQGQLAAEVRSEADKLNGEESERALADKLADKESEACENERRVSELQAELAKKEGEVGALTMALQQAILERKGVAEATQTWKNHP